MPAQRACPAITKRYLAIAGNSACRSRSRLTPAGAPCWSIRPRTAVGRSRCGRPVNDTRGAISELLGKAVNRGALDQEFTAQDKERLLAFLRRYGDLSPDLLYKGSTRSGYQVLPGLGDEVGVRRDPVAFGTLLDVDMWTGMLSEESFDFQATMFQPIGGMDSICDGPRPEARPGSAPGERSNRHPPHRQRRQRHLSRQAK